MAIPAERSRGAWTLKKKKKSGPEPTGKDISFYPSWCKRCGNCVAFCPRRALATDEWGYPHLADEERCTRCGLCEMLCPDLAISVGEGEAGPHEETSRKPAPAERPR